MSHEQYAGKGAMAMAGRSNPFGPKCERQFQCHCDSLWHEDVTSLCPRCGSAFVRKTVRLDENESNVGRTVNLV